MAHPNSQNGTAVIDRRELPTTDPKAPALGERGGIFSISLGDRFPQLATTDPILRVTHGSQLKRYSAIAAHRLVRPSLNLFTNAVFWAGFSFGGNTRNDYDLHPEYRKLDDQILRSMNRQIDGLRDATLLDVFRGMLNNGREYGNTGGAKLVYDAHLTDGEWTLSRIKTTWPYLWNYEVDDFDNLETAVYTPQDVHFNHEEIDNELIIAQWPQFQNQNWYGYSDLLAVEKAIERVDALEKSIAGGVARLAEKPIIFYYDNSQEVDIVAVREALVNLASGGVLGLPGIEAPMDENEAAKQFYRIEVLDDRASPDGLKSGQILLAEYKKEIQRALGVGDDLGYTTTSVGSRAKAETQLEVMTLNVIAAQLWIKGWADAQLVPALTRYNFRNLPSGYCLPELEWRPLEDDFFTQMAPQLLALHSGGILDAAEVREHLDLGPLPETLVEDETGQMAMADVGEGDKTAVPVLTSD